MEVPRAKRDTFERSNGCFPSCVAHWHPKWDSFFDVPYSARAELAKISKKMSLLRTLLVLWPFRQGQEHRICFLLK